MPIIRNEQIVEDSFVHVADDAEIPATGDIIVSLERYRELRDSLAKRGGKVGVRLRSDQNAKSVDDIASELPLIAITFPVFRDGRGYSTARLLRERYGYKGELRAIGDVMRDQLFYMKRCGFDAYELKAGKSIEDALNAFRDFSVTYQGAVDDPRPLFRRRAQNAR
jgi:uncharacterized protein (DUF934 family)